MARIASIGLLTLLMTLAAIGHGVAEQKKSPKQKALDKCTHNVNVCNLKCDVDTLTDDDLDTCLKGCRTKYDRCLQKVNDTYRSGGSGGDSRDQPGVLEAPQ